MKLIRENIMEMFYGNRYANVLWKYFMEYFVECFMDIIIVFGNYGWEFIEFGNVEIFRNEYAM